MNLLEFKTLLRSHPDKAFRIALPDGNAVPGSFHITEVGRVQKTFMDCGGKMHDSETCQLQVWVGEDEDHRIETQKMAGILEKTGSFLPNETVPLQIEYEDAVISRYTVDGHEVTDEAVILGLGYIHTACLAMELCGTPSSSAEPKKEESCCAGSGCC